MRKVSYKPTPVKRVEIPKPNGKGTRNLGIPIIKDRVLLDDIAGELNKLSAGSGFKYEDAGAAKTPDFKLFESI